MAHEQPGTQLGQYILGERLASGGMAEVFHARCAGAQRFDHPFVIKRMHQELAEDREFVEMFVDEARISGHLDHPNIVTQYDFEATEHGLFIVLEYVDGPDLLTVLQACAARQKPMPAELAVYTVCHLLEALDYAHNMEIRGRPVSIVHRDVSPGNVLISRRGRVRLTDFGVATASDRQREDGSGTLKGKYGYMSPEQIETKVLDGRSDIFSAGVVLAELLTGHRLFSNSNPLEVLLMARAANLERLEKYGEHIDVGLLVILEKALQRERNDRYVSAADFRDVLAGWLSGGRTRTSASALAQFVKQLDDDGYLERDEGAVDSTFSGQGTQADIRSAARAADRGRQIFEMGTMGDAMPMDMTLGAAGTIRAEPPKFPDEPEPEPEPEHYEDISVDSTLEPRVALDHGRGDFSLWMPLELIGIIVAEKRTGLLTLSQGEVQKDAYFEEGHPVFVGSNVPEERFGQFLVQRDLLQEEQLERALAAMPHFGGQLGQALVGLGLIKPVDAVHLLAQQVADKLLKSCCWESGTFTWIEELTNPHAAVTLHLSSCQIVLHAVHQLAPEHLLAWAVDHAERCPTWDAQAADAFAFGPQLAAYLETLDGTTSIGDLVTSVAEGRATLAASLYALTVCAAFAPAITE